ncbi:MULTISPECIES: MBL fold metallo-hydrolase [Allobacillus]|uniref:MBL fold metallo-hydrolase n=1 Tax=Allobacillus salarius TaxID=1955272 RepID=A0A556P8J3_9BACI|nr:MBL fold metallo-hydrolase [Allobacillus salarius]TSJ60700.1 MBL fold metallo-hydrolase [Allobacillus salarius]
MKRLSVEELAKKVLNKEATVLLDVRSTEDFQDWKVESDHFQYVNQPFSSWNGNVDQIASDLPSKDQEIVVICARGNSSQKAAKALVEAGYENVYSVEGGMRAWSEHLEPVKIGNLKDGGELYQFVRLGKGCLSYVVMKDQEAIIIDPVRMTDKFIEFTNEKGVTIKHVIDSHLHADHISGGHELAKKTNATYWLPPDDADEVVLSYEPLKNQSEIKIGDSPVTIQAVYSPGHTKGSTSLLVDEQYLLSGDILFIESIGRPDLAGKADAWVNDLRITLYEKYSDFSDDLIVLPAHYSSNHEMNEDGAVAEKLGVLYEKNKGLQVNDAEEFRRMVTENLQPQPNDHERIRQVNMGKESPDQEERREMEIGPNRCAV